ncbi:treacle protein-like [Cebidichthys violaceus]|uniref:treacle protein-like n=1 Tax=Cebidichthys violaceus TaxID=271503 RepID=UPI0035CAB729
MDDSSSSSSHVSEDELTQYTVNSDQVEKDLERHLKQDANFEQQIHGEDAIRPSVQFNQGDYKYDTQRPAVRPQDSFSSLFSDSDGERYTVKKGRVPSLAVTSHGKSLNTGATSSPAAYSSTSSSESEAEHNTDLDPQYIPQIKRRVDSNAPLPASDSSSSDESIAETTKYTKKQGQGEVDMVGLPITEYQSVRNYITKPQWSAPDLVHTKPIKRRAPSPPTDSYSRVEGADKTMDHMQKQGETSVKRLPIGVSQTGSHDTSWPVLDLEDTTRIKRRLDIKAPSPPPDSSSSSDSEDETTDQRKKQKQEETSMARLPSKVSPTVSSDPQTQWPVLDLKATTRIKRRLDIKAHSPPPDSSSSSDSEDETTDQRKKQKQEEMSMARLPSAVSPTVSSDPQTQWPVLDLKATTRIKRRLDIKAHSPPPDSSSSSDSEDETTDQRKKQKQEEMSMARLPSAVSPTVSSDPQTQWPVLDLKATTRIKRRLDIKAHSPPPDSSSSSDSEDETTDQRKKQKQEEMSMARLPSKVSPTVSSDPQTQWPVLDLEDTTRIKRRLDIKAPSPPPDSSSSSDSEDETDQRKKQKQEETSMARLPSKVSPTVSSDPQTQWPVLDLKATTRIKRRLDIKAHSPPPDSSSSSDSEDETTDQRKKQKQEEMSMARLPSKVSPTVSSDPQTQWPVLDLKATTRIKRHLDIKAPSPPPDSSSSSDSEDETTDQTKKQKQEEMPMARLPSKVSPTVSSDPQTQWPVLDLEATTRIKRRLDIKAPSPPPDSSSSSDSEDETTDQRKKQKQEETSMARLPSKVSPTVSSDPQTQWPVLDLKATTRIKRHLDIKAPSPPPDSSSSSDSEDETTDQTKKQKQEEMSMARLPSKVSPTVSSDPQTQWPVLDLKATTRIKRHLDIKAPSPPPDSSSSSDSEDETTDQTKKQKPEMSMARLPSKVSPTVSSDSQTQWPVLDLKATTRIKRHLDIKAPSPPPDSSSSSDSEDETDQRKKQKQEMSMARLPSKVSPTVSSDPQTQWPVLDLKATTHIKRRLDIKARSPPPDSSSSSDSEVENTNPPKKERPGVVGVAGWPFQETVSHDPQTHWPLLDLEQITCVKRRLDFKAPSPPLDSLLNGGSTNHTVGIKTADAIKISSCHSSSSSDEQEEGVKYLRYPQTTEPETRWPGLDLSSAFHVKRHLDIKARSPPPESSSSSDHDSEGGITNLPMKVEKDETDVGITGYQPGRGLSGIKVSVPLVKKRLNIKGPSQPTDSCSSSSDDESKLSSHTVKHERDKGYVVITDHEHQTQLHKLSPGIPYINRRLDFKAPSLQPDPVLSNVSPGSRQSELNSSGSDGENAKLGLGVSAISKATEKDLIRLPKTPVLNTSRSPKTDHNIKLEKYTSIKDEVGDKTSGNISTTPEINPELQSRWATMNLGISRFRKRLEITSQTHEPPNLPSSPPPDSPSSSSSESGTGSKSSGTRRKKRGVGMQGKIQTESSLTPETIPVNVSLSFKGQGDNTVEGTERLRLSEGTEGNPDTTLTGFGIPHLRRYLDIKVKALDIRTQRESSSSSSSEDETIGLSVVDLSLGVPRVKRRLDVKGPLPSNSPSSCSESENEVTGYTANQSRPASNMSDNDSLITYKRVILKTSSLPSNSAGPSFTPKRVPSMSFDVVKRRTEQPRSTTGVVVLPEIRWTGVGRQLSDLSIPSPRRHRDVGLSSPPVEPELPPPDSSNSSSSESDDNTKEDKGRAEVSLMQKHSSLGARSVFLDTFDTLKTASEVRNERKGLGALKAMSSERRKWDTTDETLAKSASPLFDDYGPQSDARFDYRKSEKEVRSSTSRATDLSYGIPRYRRHDIGGTGPPQWAPPPIPATPPPPYKAVGRTWRSPRSSNTEESVRSSLTPQNLAAYSDFSNISEV